MTHRQIIERCLQKKGAYLDHPFGLDYPVVRVKALSQEKGRIFAQLFYLHGEAKVTLNCTPDAAAFYRLVYPGAVVRGWHCPPVQQPHVNTVSLDGAVPDEVILSMIDHAYEVVVAKYPRHIQAKIGES